MPIDNNEEDVKNELESSIHSVMCNLENYSNIVNNYNIEEILKEGIKKYQRERKISNLNVLTNVEVNNIIISLAKLFKKIVISIEKTNILELVDNSKEINNKPSKSTLDLVLSTTDVVRLLKTTPPTVRKLCKDGVINSFKNGKCVQIYLKDLLQGIKNSSKHHKHYQSICKEYGVNP